MSGRGPDRPAWPDWLPGRGPLQRLACQRMASELVAPRPLVADPGRRSVSDPASGPTAAAAGQGGPAPLAQPPAVAPPRNWR